MEEKFTDHLIDLWRYKNFEIKVFENMVQWNCRDDCKYHCMHKTTDAFIARKWNIPQVWLIEKNYLKKLTRARLVPWEVAVRSAVGAARTRFCVLLGFKLLRPLQRFDELPKGCSTWCSALYSLACFFLYLSQRLDLVDNFPRERFSLNRVVWLRFCLLNGSCFVLVHDHKVCQNNYFDFNAN